MRVPEHRPRRSVMLAPVLAIGLGVAAVDLPSAQQSPSFRLTEATSNSGGGPVDGARPASPSFRLSMVAIGDDVVHGPASGASFTAEGGFVSPYRPAGEVAAVAFADADTLVWAGTPAAGTYHVYRDGLASLGGLVGACFATDVSSATIDDPDPPGAGQGFLYLVTVVDRLGEEGTPGSETGGHERGLSAPCP